MKLFGTLWFLLLLNAPVATVLAQGCPAVVGVVDTLLANPALEPSVRQSVGKSCPEALDSLSRIYHQLSITEYKRTSAPYGLAIAYGERALGVQRRLYQDTMELPLAKTLANLGLFQRLAGAYDRARAYLTEADRAFEQIGNLNRRFRNWKQMVLLEQHEGNYTQVTNVLEAIRAAGLAYDRPDMETYVLLQRGVMLIQNERYRQAIAQLRQAVLTDEEQGGSWTGYYAGYELGRALYYEEKYAAATAQFKDVLEIARASELHNNVADINNLLALIALREGRAKVAQAYVEAGLAAAYRTNDVVHEALLLNTRAAAHAQASPPELIEAVRANRRALNTLAPTWRYSTETPVPTAAGLVSQAYRLDLFETLADHEKYLTAYAPEAPDERGLRAEALAALTEADAVADLLRTDFSGETTRLFWRKQALPLYDRGLRLSAEADDPAAAYRFFEKSRAVLLLEDLLEAEVLERIDAPARDHLRQLERSLAAARVAQADSSEASTDSDRTVQRLIRLQASADSLREVLAGRYPQANDLLIRPALADLATSRRELAAGGWDRQIHFRLGAEEAWAFVLTADAASLTPLASPDSLAPALRALLAYYTGPQAIDQNPRGYLAAAHRVYELTLGELKVPAGERLLIIPDGLLAYVPFSALVTEAGATDLATAPYLLHRNPLSYAQSATILARQAKTANSGGAYVAFSPFTGATPRGDVATLPYSQRETEGLETTIGLTNWLDATAANRTALLEAAPTANLLHLSTHAYATPDETSRPRVLTYTDPIYLPDIYNLTLDADLVTLSACQSNIGPLAQGEGVLGLGRAFTAAGARGVVASLWSLNDRATADIVTDFYAALADGESKPAALHRAQLAYLDRTDLPGYLKSPYYWAGLTYYGNAGSLQAKSGNWLWWIGGLVVVVLLLGGQAKLRKARPTG